MKPVSRALCNELLKHHQQVCVNVPAGQINIKNYVIAYGELCRRAGCKELVGVIQSFLQEIAIWCNTRPEPIPPINALAVNQDTLQPGDGYDNAPGCSIAHWPDEAEKCIRFTKYPQTCV